MLKVNKIDFETAVELLKKEWASKLESVSSTRLIDVHEEQRRQRISQHVYCKDTLYFKDACSLTNAKRTFAKFFGYDFDGLMVDETHMRFQSSFSGKVIIKHRLDLGFFYGWK